MAGGALVNVRAGFVSLGWPSDVVDETLAAYGEAKKRYYRADLRPSAVEGGRFSEAVLRLLQFIATGAFTPLSDRRFKADAVMNQLERSPAANASDSVRLNIPRALRLIYDIRNNRDTAHLRDGIDPNLQDATLVISCMDWVLAELVRIGHNTTPEAAQELIKGIVVKEVPLIEEFDGRPVLLADVKIPDHILILLYWANADDVSLGDLRSWVPVSARKNLLRTLRSLESKHLIHLGSDVVRLTRLGIRSVEERELLKPL